MKIEGKILILDGDIEDAMVNEFIEIINKNDIETIKLETNNISSLVMQQLFCIKANEEKEIVCNDVFLAKFFKNVGYKVA
jgi:hypothetical protein